MKRRMKRRKGWKSRRGRIGPKQLIFQSIQIV
jgi:hypothetical protein